MPKKSSQREKGKLCKRGPARKEYLDMQEKILKALVTLMPAVVERLEEAVLGKGRFKEKPVSAGSKKNRKNSTGNITDSENNNSSSQEKSVCNLTAGEIIQIARLVFPLVVPAFKSINFNDYTEDEQEIDYSKLDGNELKRIYEEITGGKYYETGF